MYNTDDDEAFFVDENGNKISSDTISSHIGLALIMLEKNEELKKEFEDSGKENPIEFFISNKGYIAGGTMGTYKSIIYKSSSISEKQKKILTYYYEEGYNLKDETLVDNEREI